MVDEFEDAVFGGLLVEGKLRGGSVRVVVVGRGVGLVGCGEEETVRGAIRVRCRRC